MGREQRYLRAPVREGGEHPLSNGMGRAGAHGGWSGGFGGRTSGRRSPAAGVGARRPVERSDVHRARFPAGFLSQVSWLQRVFSAVGARRFPHAQPPRTHALSGAGVVAALDLEARSFRPRTRRRDGLFEVGDGTLVAVSGMGRAAAVDAAGALVDAGATALVSWGLAGGLDPALQAGTICLPSMVVSRDGAAFATDLHWREILTAAISRRLIIVSGKLLTSAVAIEDIAAKAAAFAETGAVAGG